MLELITGPIIWFVGLIAALVVSWFSGNRSAKKTSDLAKLEEKLKQINLSRAKRKEIEDAIEKSRSDGADWYDRLSTFRKDKS